MLESLKQRWQAAEPGQRKLTGVLSGAFLVTMLVSGLVLHSRATMTSLFSELPANETREIANELTRQGVDFKVSDDESSVSVPVREAARARMRLAAAGLPASAPPKGWEIFGEGGLAVTKPQQQALQIRALQGELARSIASLDKVTKAAVHISLKQDSPFVDQLEPAKAAVLLHLKPSAAIDRQQAMAIAHLVSRSVPDLETAQITILDQKGTLLFSDNVAHGTDSGDGVQRAERELERRVQSQLDSAFGLGKTIVRATAELQTERTEIKRTTYTPADNQREGVAGKETVETEDYSGAGGGGRVGGVPGTGANLFGQAKLPAAASGPGRYTRNKSDRDYLVNQQQEVIVKPGGGLKRITLGIFVDEALAGDKTKVESVARSAAGLDSQRGDTISVESVKFSPSSTDTLNGVSRADMVRNIARLVLNALAMVIGLLTFRSILGALKPAPPVAGYAGGAEAGRPGGPVPMLTDAAQGQNWPALTSPQASLTGPTAAAGHPGGAPMNYGEGPGLTLPRDNSMREELPLLDAPMDDFDDDLVVPVATGPTPEELIGRVETAIIDDIAEVLRHWLEGDLNE